MQGQSLHGAWPSPPSLDSGQLHGAVCSLLHTSLRCSFSVWALTPSEAGHLVLKCSVYDFSVHSLILNKPVL